MSYYEISYLNFQQERVKETFQFADHNKLNIFFERHNLEIINVKEITEATFSRGFGLTKKISMPEVIEIVNHLYIMVKAALPLHHSLEDLALESSNPRIKSVLLHLSNSVENGNSLSLSLEPFHKLFGFSTIYLIRIGEETGTLEQTLKKAKNFLVQSSALKTRVRLALIYPLTVLTVAFIAIVLWFTFVLPQMAEMFASMELELPLLTRFLMSVSDIVSSSYLYVFATIMLLLFIVWQAQKSSQNVRRKLHSRLLAMPIVGQVIKDLNVAYITEFLYLSLSTGTSLFKAIKLIGDNISNSVYQESMKNVAKHLENGLSLSAAFQKEKIYNPFTIRMLNMGEQSGDLESQLYTISEYYSGNVQSSTTQMTKVIEPAMIIFVGFVFALIMLGLMGPIFDIMATI